MKIDKPKKWIFPLLCYGVALVIWLGISGFMLGMDTLRAQKGELRQTALRLDAPDVQLDGVDLRKQEDGWQFILARGTDPNIVYAPEAPFYATRLTFKATPHRPPGELVLYTTDAPQPIDPKTDFSEKKKLWARQNADGSWYFELGGREYTALRLDPGNTSGVLWAVEKLVLNEAKPVWQYFIPDARVAFVLLLAPGFFALALREAGSAARMLRLRKRAK